VVTSWALASEGSSLDIRDVSRSFRAADGSSVLALNKLTLSIRAGEMVSLIGPSGCGKSTLLRMIAGLDQPSSGELRVGSSPIVGPSAERGLMFQEHNLFPWLTVRANVQSGLVARGLLSQYWNQAKECLRWLGLDKFADVFFPHQSQYWHEAEEYLRLVGLDGFANVYPHQLSGGMAQRAALARAIINHPKILLLDEPLGALDQFTRMRMQDEVLRVWEARGTTMMLVTHDIDEAIYMSDRIAVMTPRPGRLERLIDVRLDRPRSRTSPRFLELRAAILDELHLSGRSEKGVRT
jgi:NitT/TauT family transport system ATP-binding protein/sulfonate transport system ATP-binding protein